METKKFSFFFLCHERSSLLLLLLGGWKQQTCEWNWVIKLLKPFSSRSSFTAHSSLSLSLSHIYHSIFCVQYFATLHIFSHTHARTLIVNMLNHLSKRHFSRPNMRKERIQRRPGKMLHLSINYAFKRENKMAFAKNGWLFSFCAKIMMEKWLFMKFWVEMKREKKNWEKFCADERVKYWYPQR